MTKTMIWLSFALTLGWLPGCSSAASAPALENTDWRLARLGGRPVTETAKRTPTIRLASDGRKLQGWTGCNRTMGSYQIDGRKLELGPLATTRMACADGSDLEPGFLRVLEATVGWRIADGLLELLGPSGESLATFQPAKAAERE